MSEDGVSVVDAALEGAAVYNPSDASPSTEPSGKPETQISQAVPYPRFHEVVVAKNDAVFKAKELETKNKELSDKYTEASDLLNRIRGLAEDERLAPYVYGIDKALRGVSIEEVINQMSTATTTPETNNETTVLETKPVTAPFDVSAVKKEVAEEVSGLTKSVLDSVEDKLTDHTTDYLLELAQDRAAKYLDALPPEYTDKDKQLIAKLWTPSVNWDAIEETPSSMMSELTRSFQEVLTEYGEPKGIVEKKVQETVEAKMVAPPATQLSALMEKNWGAWNAEKKTAEVSDDDFSKVLAHAIRLGKVR